MRWCVDVLMRWWRLCWCIDVLMPWWVDALICWCGNDCVDVLMCWCVDPLICWYGDDCIGVLMCWWVHMLSYWCGEDCVDVLMCWWLCGCVDMLKRWWLSWSIEVLMRWCVDMLIIEGHADFFRGWGGGGWSVNFKNSPPLEGGMNFFTQNAVFFQIQEAWKFSTPVSETRRGENWT